MLNFPATGWLWWVAWHFLFWTQEWLVRARWVRVGAQRPPSLLRCLLLALLHPHWLRLSLQGRGAEEPS